MRLDVVSGCMDPWIGSEWPFSAVSAMYLRAHASAALGPVGDIQTETIPLQHYPFDLIERDLVVAAVEARGRTRAFVRSHLLCVFQKSAVQQIHCDPGRPEGMAAKFRDDPSLQSATNDHAPRILSGHALHAELLTPAAPERAEQGRCLSAPMPAVVT